MLIVSNKYKRRILLVLSLGLTASTLYCFADEAAKNDQQSTQANSKKCLSDMLKGCCDREQHTSQAISELLDKLKTASDTNDATKMKSALDNAREALSSMKEDHDKSAALLKTLHNRIDKLKKQIKVARDEHNKAANILEDEDMDQVFWAY